MQKQHSIYTNIVLNIIRTSLYVIFPLITFPYVSRVLMAENLGKVNYATSVVNYFALIAALGLSTYGVREGARVRNDKRKFSTFANEVFTVNIIMTVIAYACLFVLLLIPKFYDYRYLILLLSASIILTTLGVDWVNLVFEDYIYITIRSFIVQLFVLVVMFIIVRKPEDYYNYALISVLSSGIISILNFFYTRKKYCKVRIIKNCRFIHHIKGLIVFFANNLAMNIYLNADVTMLGLMTTDYTVGIYSVAVKVYGVVKAVIAAAFTASISRLSAYYVENKDDEYTKLLNDLISLCSLLIFPSVAGLIALSKPIILILSGDEYLDAYKSLSIVCFGLIGAIYGGIMTSCVNLPMRKEKQNLQATVLAAISNIMLNLVMIPLFKEIGAAITTVVAELVVFTFCYFTNREVKKLIDFRVVLKHIATGCGGMMIVFSVAKIVSLTGLNWIIQTVVIVTVSVISYLTLIILTQNPFVEKIKARRMK